jgi:hypothetical protein
MNALLLQLIATQASANGNSRVAEVLARLRSASSANTTMDAKELLAQLGESNPMAKALLNQMAQERALAANTIDVEPIDEKPELPEHGSSSDDSAAALAELRKQSESLCAELGILRERNDLFAAALGACCHCWGQDPSCRSCRGRGGPGFSVPDEALFVEYVVPAIQMLRAHKAKGHHPSPRVTMQSPDAETQVSQPANF